MVQFSSLYTSYLDEELGTDDTIRFTVTRRKAAINKGAARFANLTQCLTRQITFAITGGTAEYDLNSTLVIPSGDFNDLAKEGVEFQYTDASSNVTILARDDLLRRDIDWLNQEDPGWRLSTVASTAQQLPMFYYLRSDGAKRLIGFVPTPSTGSSASAVVNMTYVANAPAMVNATDQPYTFGASYRADLNNYHMALVHYAAHQLEKLRQDDQRSGMQMQKFMGYVAQFLQDQRIKGGRQIRQAKHYLQRHTGTWGAWRVWTGR